MTPTCTRCGTSNASAARFCQGCGVLLGATQVQGRTVVLPSSPSVAGAPVDQKTMMRRVREAFGNQVAYPGPRTVPAGRMKQREQTALVNDVSESMSERFDAQTIKLQASIRASINLILNKAQIDAMDEMALITFNSLAQVLMGFNPIATHKPQMIQILQALQPSDGTDINAGLVEAHGLFDLSRNDVVSRIVLLTDGQGGDPLDTAEELKSRGVVLDVVGVGDKPSNVNEALLRKVASVIDGQLRYRFIKDQQTLLAHYTQLAQKTATGR